MGEMIASYAARSGSLSLGRAVLVLAGSSFVLQLASLVLLFLLFPNGRPASRRLRLVMWLVLASNWRFVYLGVEPSGILAFLNGVLTVFGVAAFWPRYVGPADAAPERP